MRTSHRQIRKRILEEKSEDDIKGFGNARGVRNTFEKVLIHQANRLAAMQELTKEDLMQLTEADILELLPGVSAAETGEDIR